jgi:hypothetical protein
MLGPLFLSILHTDNAMLFTDHMVASYRALLETVDLV